MTDLRAEIRTALLLAHAGWCQSTSRDDESAIDPMTDAVMAAIERRRADPKHWAEREWQAFVDEHPDGMAEALQQVPAPWRSVLKARFARRAQDSGRWS